MLSWMTRFPATTKLDENKIVLAPMTISQQLFDRPRRTSDISSPRGSSGDPDSARTPASPLPCRAPLISW